MLPPRRSRTMGFADDNGKAQILKLGEESIRVVWGDELIVIP